MRINLALLMLGVSLFPQVALAQDVVMRRPLPHKAPQNAVTPTPTSEEAGTSSYHGWKLDCSVPKLSCMQANVVGNTTTTSEVDASLCPATQTAEKNSLATARGWTPLGAGIDKDTGTRSCTQNPPEDPEDDDEPNTEFPQRMNIALAQCDSGINVVACIGVTVNSLSEVMSGVSGGGEEVPLAECAKQNPNDAAYATFMQVVQMVPDLAPIMDMVVAPSQVMTKNGSSCSGTNYSSVAGSMCEAGVSRCMVVNYTASGPVGDRQYNISAPNYVVGTPENPGCQNTASLSEDERAVLRVMNLTPSGSNACASAPEMYGANGTCINTVRYEGSQTIIEAQFKMTCYGVKNLGGGDISTTPATPQQCDSQTLTPAQAEFLDSLSPAIQNPLTMDRNCQVKGGVNLNYQRDTVAEESRRVLDSYYIGEAGSWALGWELVERTYRFPYVCTDVNRGDGARPAYFDPYSYAGGSAFKSNYPIDRDPCFVEHAMDKHQLIEEGKRPSNFTPRNMDAWTETAAKNECTRIMRGYQTPGHIAQCGVDISDNDQDGVTYVVRVWEEVHM